MKEYNYNIINEHIQWLMEMMNIEYPNNYEIVISSNYAEIRNKQTELNFGYKPKDIKPLFIENITIQQFFKGEYYIVFDNKSEVTEFLTFINNYDNKWNNLNEDTIEKIKSAAWIYSDSLYRHQLEWMDNKEWFKRYNMNPIPYKVVCEEIKNFLKAKKCINDLMKKVVIKDEV